MAWTSHRRAQGTSLSALLVGAFLLATQGPGCKKDWEGQFEAPKVGEPDLLASGPITMSEGEVVAWFEGQDLLVRFQVTAPEELSRGLTGTCRLESLGLEGIARVGQAPAAFSREAGAAMGACRLSEARNRLEEHPLGNAVLDIQVATADGAHRLAAHVALGGVLERAVVEALGPNTLDAEGSGTVRVLAHATRTGRALPGVPVRVELSQGGRVWTAASGETDEAGQLLLTYRVDTDSDAPVKTWIVAAFETGDASSPVLHLARTRPGLRLVLTTDKPIYQPEQTIHIRLLALEGPRRTPVAGREVLFTLFDAKGRKVAKVRAETDEYGIAATQVKLGRVIDLGSYRLEASLGSHRAEKTLQVSRYALPRFRVSLQTDRPYYLPGETVSGVLEAEYFFRQKVVGANCRIQAFTYVAGLEEIADVTVFTDEQGRAAFSFPLPDRFYGNEFLQGNALLVLQAVVTDGTGHEEEASISLPVAPSDVLLFVVPGNPRLAPGVENPVLVETVSPAGQPLECSVNLAREGTLLASGQTDTNGIAVLSLPVNRSPLVLQASAFCAGGFQTVREVTLGDPDGHDVEGLVVLADKPSAKVGDTVQVTILAPRARDLVYLDVVRSGRPVVTATIPISQGQGTYDLQVSPDMEGLCELRVYYLGSSGVLVRNTRLLYVPVSNRLQVALSTDKEEYRPGETARLQVTVTDPTGQGVPAAVGISVVDEAVFAITEFKAGLERQFYDFEEELRNPAYQIKSCSFRDVERAAEDAGAREKATLYLAALAPPDSFYGLHLKVSDIPMDTDLQALTVRVLSDARTVAQALARDRLSDSERVQDLVDGMELFDPWGQAYRRTANTRRVCLASSGPDELMATNDDLTACATIPRPSTHGADGGYLARDGGILFEADGGMFWADAGASGQDAGGGSPSVRTRKDFPETLLFEPALVTDQNGQASLDVPLADTITTWRVSAIANARTGGLGSATGGILVFQPFFLEPDLPAYLLDSVAIELPVAVYNYTSEPQDVTVHLRPESWFRLTDGDTRTITVPANGQAAVSFPMEILEVGRQTLRVEGSSAQFADAVEKSILVRPNGKEFAATCGGLLGPGDSRTCTVEYPSLRVPGADELLVKMYGGPLAHAVEGLDSLIREPFG